LGEDIRKARFRRRMIGENGSGRCIVAAGTLSLEEFAKKLTQGKTKLMQDPVIVLEDGVPANVWLSYHEFEKLIGPSKLASAIPPLVSTPHRPRTLLDVFNHPAFDSGADDLEFEKAEIEFRPVDFG